MSEEVNAKIAEESYESNSDVLKVLDDGIAALYKWIANHTTHSGGIKARSYEHPIEELQNAISSIKSSSATLYTKLDDTTKSVVEDVMTMARLESELASARSELDDAYIAIRDLRHNITSITPTDKDGKPIVIGDAMTINGYDIHVVKAIGKNGYFADDNQWYISATANHAVTDISELIQQLITITASLNSATEKEDIDKFADNLVGISKQIQRVTEKRGE